MCNKITIYCKCLCYFLPNIHGHSRATSLNRLVGVEDTHLGGHIKGEGIALGCSLNTFTDASVDVRPRYRSYYAFAFCGTAHNSIDRIHCDLLTRITEGNKKAGENNKKPEHSLLAISDAGGFAFYRVKRRFPL